MRERGRGRRNRNRKGRRNRNRERGNRNRNRMRMEEGNRNRRGEGLTFFIRYGGAIGHVGFDGNINTGLTLRTIRIIDGVAQV